LGHKPDYLPIPLSFEAFEGWPLADFLHGFSLDLGRRLVELLQTRAPSEVVEVQKLLMSDPPDSFFALRERFVALHQLLPDQRMVLMIDEFDGTPRDAISHLLQMWRQMYLDSSSPRPLHSVILIGLQNIATLNLERSSPFNIARQFQLPPFKPDEVQGLLAQYTTETGQTFAPGVVDEIYYQTGGPPFLVNRLAAIATEDIAIDRTQPIIHADLEIALENLLQETNYNFEALARRAREYREDVLNILFSAEYAYNLNYIIRGGNENWV
jgi:hypothetical protein